MEKERLPSIGLKNTCKTKGKWLNVKQQDQTVYYSLVVYLKGQL